MLRCLSVCVLCASVAQAAAPVDFNREVRPILSAHCFKCHGPDPATREADLRLDTQEGLFAPREGQAAFTAGDPGKSEALRRILAEDDSERMPPPDAKKDLTPREIAVIKAWVEQGAKWEPHWAFVAPQRSPLPSVKNSAWPRNAIDSFVLARLEAEGLSPTAEADRYTLMRRVSLDLIGLPPTPEEADAFVNDSSPDAYERLVDRLLASPRYGERWARRWLDLARYADTNGYEKDRPRTIWPYRDWVIDALNAGMPFDEFTVKQLAGDLLPGATVDDRVATGFHRNTMLNEEGGIDPLEFRFHAMTDRVATTGTTWLGLTIGCAQCHDHKYDPVTQREYYGLMAFLDNADEPELRLPDPALDAAYAKNLAEADRLIADLPNRWPAGETNWRVVPIANATAKSGQAPETLGDGSVLFAAPGSDRDTYTLVFETETPADRLRIETLTDDRLPSRGPGRVAHGNFVLSEVAVSAAPRARPDELVPVNLTSATADVEQSGFPASNAIDGKAATGWAVHAGNRLNADHSLTLGLAEPAGFPGGTRFVVTLVQGHGQHHTIGRIRVGVLADAPKPTEEVRRAVIETRFAEWLDRERARTVPWTTLRPVEMKSNLPHLTLEKDGSIFVTGDTSKQDTYELAFRPGVKGITAVRIEALPDERLPAGGPGMTYYEGAKGDFFLNDLRLTADGRPVAIAKGMNGLAADGTGNAAAAAAAIDTDLQSGWSADGRQGERLTAVFVLGEPVSADELRVTMGLGRYYASSLGRFRISVTTAPPPEARDLPEDVERLLAKTDAELTSEDRARLRTEFLLRAPELAGPAKRIRELRKRPEGLTTLVFRERPAANPRPTYLRNRGEYLQPKDRVEPTTLETLHPFPADAPRNRLAFAKWLVARENPLTARVAVNREWAAYFGLGLVPTVQDFGFTGAPPSHPELLDWLAVEFMESGWDVKRLHRSIVTSATYRQNSEVADLGSRIAESAGSKGRRDNEDSVDADSPAGPSEAREGQTSDPQNVLLARGPRVRLEAELIRDSALAACGVLSPKVGGPPVRPPQPEGVTETAYGGARWDASTGEDRYRRSVYTFLKRTAPFAMFTVFDATSGEACTARRDVSNTPLQSLTLLNDEMFLEAARAFGAELAARGGSDAGRAAYAFRRVLTRPPDSEETRRLVAFVTAQRERIANGELKPEALAGGGDDAGERAVWTALVRALLSLDEAVTRS